MPPSPLSPAQRRVLDGALEVVRDQRRRADLENRQVGEANDAFTPIQAWATPFGLGYLIGVVDALCQVYRAPFDSMALAVWGLVLEDTFGRVEGDRLRQRGLDALEADDADFNRGRPWGGNEAMGAAQGQHVPVGLVHLARGDEHRMGGAG